VPGALILASFLGLACMETQATNEVPFTHDFTDCGDKWLEEETDQYSFSCVNGHYHFLVKASASNQSSLTKLSEPEDRIQISVDAAVDDIEGESAVGLGCWHGASDTAPGYRVFIGLAGWEILKERADGTAGSIPSTESGLQPQVDEEALTLRADCLAGVSGTEVKIFINGTLVGTGHDASGVDQFDEVGMMISVDKAPVAVDFDNFHVEVAQP
jgi:hypothetical protein